MHYFVHVCFTFPHTYGKDHINTRAYYASIKQRSCDTPCAEIRIAEVYHSYKWWSACSAADPWPSCESVLQQWNTCSRTPGTLTSFLTFLRSQVEVNTPAWPSLSLPKPLAGVISCWYGMLLRVKGSSYQRYRTLY